MNNTPKKKPNKWLVLINIPIQMGVVIFLFSKGGNWLDDYYPNKHNVFVKVLTLLGIAISFYNLNRQLKDLNS
ncbi:AtpZ/AtpI family protein [Flavobacterium sp.]|uniref:AtpZ/AtpI family protein n=1 Tax=Flavobacterium sp. TaxID=239 RepID=UPI001AC2F183|nr:AtpZ/AtpI family protein [Flavobacterium sp.]MBN8640983.1 AtpZ/AtpI family protein [Flavobacteriales bacterium]HLP63352.1 AtpZ/AtpI family protein [Flavobacterium sp.]